MHNSIRGPGRRWLWFWLAGAAIPLLSQVACTRQPAGESRPTPPVLGTQVTEHRDLLQATVKLAVGSRCDNVGKDGCLDGVCLSVGPDCERRVCSKPCLPADATTCPRGFACAQLYPSNDVAWFCAPLAATTGGAP